EPLTALAGPSFFSLQKGDAERELPASGFAERVVPLGPLLGNLADTAAVIVELDLVISVDTVVAHLAATLGKPTWIMLAFAADWRWLAEGETSPWYPAMRLFRQERHGDWPGLVARLEEALRARLATAGDLA